VFNKQADAIEMVAAENMMNLTVTGGDVTPRCVKFSAIPNAGVSVSRVESLARAIALALDVSYAHVIRQGGAIRIEVPRSDPQPLRLLPLMARIPTEKVPFGTATLGLAEDGVPLMLCLPAPDVGNVLIAGTSGVGKTALLHSIIMSLALFNNHRHLQFALIDPSGDAFAPLAGLPHVLYHGMTLIGNTSALDNLLALLEQREQSHVSDPRIVIVIDELERISSSSDKIATLSNGGLRGIHVVAATQKPSAYAIGPLVKAHFPVRIVGRVVSDEDARAAAGVPDTGAEKLAGVGDFIACHRHGLIRFQSAYMAVSEISACAQKIASGSRVDEILRRPT
jgi:S-DNA-T family DNA segregation ATPase FtsK/SpoIIIE